MSSLFVPLLAPKSKSPAALASIEAGATGSIAPLSPAPAEPPTAASNHSCGTPVSALSAVPSISLEREGDHVAQIRIQCACGQVIELECAH